MSGIERIELWPSLSQSIVNSMPPPHEPPAAHPGRTEVNVPRAEAPAPAHFEGQAPETGARAAAHHPRLRGSGPRRAPHASAGRRAGLIQARDPMRRAAWIAFAFAALALAITLAMRSGPMGLYLAVLGAVFVLLGLWIERSSGPREP